jgi:hypothetical protein
MTHDTESGSYPEASVTSNHGSSTSAHIDQSVNKTMPWIALLAILSTAALVISIMGLMMQRDRYSVLWDKYQLVERECRLAQNDITEMKRGN